MFPLKITVTGFFSCQERQQLHFASVSSSAASRTPSLPAAHPRAGLSQVLAGSESGLPAPPQGPPAAALSLSLPLLLLPHSLSFISIPQVPPPGIQRSLGQVHPPQAQGPRCPLSAMASVAAGPTKARAGERASLCLSLACGVLPAGAERSVESRPEGGPESATDPLTSSSNKK